MRTANRRCPLAIAAAAAVALALPAPSALATARGPECEDAAPGPGSTGTTRFFTTTSPQNALRVTVTTCARRTSTGFAGATVVRWTPLGTGRPAKRFSRFDLGYRSYSGSARTAISGGCTDPGDTRSTALLTKINAKLRGKYRCTLQLDRIDGVLPGPATLATSITYGFLKRSAQGPFTRELGRLSLD